jgi:hypothetical protein
MREKHSPRPRFSVTLTEKIYRAPDVTGKDLELLCAVADPQYNVDTIANKDLQKALGKTDWAKSLEDRKPASGINRRPRPLRGHGLMKKLPKRHKCMLTDKEGFLPTCAVFCCAYRR